MEDVIIKSDYEIERRKPIPSRNHAIIQSRIIKMLYKNYEEEFEAVSELSLMIDETEKIPDVSIYKNFDFQPGNDEIKVDELPLAVIEILSPEQHLIDLIIKSKYYFEAGILSYWLVIPDLKTVYIYSDVDEYEAFVRRGKLVDTKLNIELDLKELFK